MKLTEICCAIQALAVELHQAGAIRPEADTKFSALRTAIDQAVEAADTAEKAAEQPAPPSALEFYQAVNDQIDKLVHAVEAVGVVVDHTGDQVSDLAAKLKAA